MGLCHVLCHVLDFGIGAEVLLAGLTRLEDLRGFMGRWGMGFNEGSSSSVSTSESKSEISFSSRALLLGEEDGVEGWDWKTSRKVSFADWKMRGDLEGEG